jgi:phosphoribosylglycinamide formyltransferase-1
MRRLGILGSTRGTNLIALVDAIQHKKLDASIEIVLSNKQEAGILTLAQQFQLPHQFVNPENLSREKFDEKISVILQAKNVDFIVLIGYMRILSKEFVTKWENKIINVHPSLLPDFAGGMDMQVHQAVLDAGVKETGCTVHVVTEEVDSGPILLQKKCWVEEGDTAESLKARVQKLEGDALIEAIRFLTHR